MEKRNVRLEQIMPNEENRRRPKDSVHDSARESLRKSVNDTREKIRAAFSVSEKLKASLRP